MAFGCATKRSVARIKSQDLCPPTLLRPRIVSPRIPSWNLFEWRTTNVTTLDSMLERNKDFAASQSAARELMPRALPNVKAIIIGCADMRVDPAHVLGIKPGEAVVMRNIGGRNQPGRVEQMGVLRRRSEGAGARFGGGGGG